MLIVKSRITCASDTNAYTANRVNGAGVGKQVVPRSMHDWTRLSSSVCSRAINATADPNITKLPARLPRIDCPVSQIGHATSRPPTSGNVAPTRIQFQFSPESASIQRTLYLSGYGIWETG